jgi:hypothetical protein
MHYIRANNTSSNPSRRHPPKQHGRRHPINWDRLRDIIRREHRLITAVDPRSSRVRPTLSLVQWSER